MLKGSIRLPCKFVDSGRLLRRVGFKRYESTYVYLFDDMLVILSGAKKTCVYVLQCVSEETTLSPISKRGKFYLKAPSLRFRNQISSVKLQGV